MDTMKHTDYVAPRAEVKGSFPTTPLAISGNIGDLPANPVYEEEF